MTDVQNPAGGAGGGSGGAAPTDDSSQPSQNGNGGGTKTVSWENHKRALDDLHKFKSEANELRAKLGDAESERLKKENDYKSLYEREKARADASDQKVKEVTGWAMNTQRFAAVKEAALAGGLRKEALPDLELLELKDVQVEVTSTGRFHVEGAKESIDRLKTERPHWFGTAVAPRINAGGGGGAPPSSGDPNRKLTVDDVNQAERDWKRGRISKAQYEETHHKYVKQNPRNAAPGEEPPR